MKILVGCEFSGIVRDAFTAKGHDTTSIDLIESERPGKHIMGDIETVLNDGWDMMIVFPPCTYLCRSGAQWYSGTDEMFEALEFVVRLMDAPIPKIALENPIGAINSRIQKPTQIVQPFWFGHPETKSTCLWLKNLPKLVATDKVLPVNGSRVHREPPGIDRWKRRSRTMQGLANAMADQWG